MGIRRFLVLGDEQNVEAERGALALEVDGQRHFPEAYKQATERGLPADVVWLEWVREDPLWAGASDGAYSGMHFRELEGVGLTRYTVKDDDVCPAAAVFSPINCNGPDCAKRANETCFRIINSRPLYHAASRRRHLTERGPGAVGRN